MASHYGGELNSRSTPPWYPLWPHPASPEDVPANTQEQRGPVEPGSNHFPPPLGPDKSQSSSQHPPQSCRSFPPLTLVSHPHTCGPACIRGQSPGLRLRWHQHSWWGHPLHQPASVRSAPSRPAYQPSPSPPLRSWGLDLARPFMHIRSRWYRNGIAWRLPSKTVIHLRPSAEKIYPFVIFQSPNCSCQFIHGLKWLWKYYCWNWHFTWAFEKRCQHASKVIFMRANDISAANTSGQEMLYVLPSSRSRQKTR